MVFISSRHWGRGVVSCEQLYSLSQPQYMPQGIEKLKTGKNIHILRLQATNQFFLSSLRGAGSDRSEEAVDCDRKEDLIFQREQTLSPPSISESHRQNTVCCKNTNLSIRTRLIVKTLFS